MITIITALGYTGAVFIGFLIGSRLLPRQLARGGTPIIFLIGLTISQTQAGWLSHAGDVLAALFFGMVSGKNQSSRREAV